MPVHNSFLKSYTDILKNNLRKGMVSDYYYTDTYPVNKSQVIQINLPDPSLPEDLCDKKIATISDKRSRHNFEAARLLYEALEELPGVVAADESFWAYLCHNDLYRFVQKDWSLEDKLENTPSENYIEGHYFFGHGPLRNALAGLWWGVKLSVDESRQDKYELSRVMFKNYSLRVNWLTIALRIRPVLHGILEYLYSHPEIMKEKEEARYRFIANYVNRLGSTKELAAMAKEYIQEQLEMAHSEIMNAKIIKPKKNTSEELDDGIDLFDGGED